MVAVAAMGVTLIWTGRHGEGMAIDRSAQVISIRYQVSIGVELDEVRRLRSEVALFGVVFLPGDGPSLTALDLTATGGILYSMSRDNTEEPDGVTFAETLRDHVASAGRIGDIAPTRQRGGGRRWRCPRRSG